MEYYYDFESLYPGLGEGFAMGFVGVVLALIVIFALVILAVSVVSYVLGAIGLYRIAKRRGIHHAWLAWIPVGNSWLLGSVSDHYQYVSNHKVTQRRRVLLIMGIVTWALSFVEGVCTGLISAMGNGSNIALGMVVTILFSLVVLGVSLAYVVIAYVAYYDLFRSCKPGSAVLFLVLGIIFSFTLPFFVFAISGSDKGMPERRAPRSEAPQSIPEETPVEEEIPVVEAEVVEEPIEE